MTSFLQRARGALGMSVLSIALCAAMLIGTTFAWFTDTASTAVNKIQAGTLDVALEMKDGDRWVSAEGKTLDFVKSPNAPAGEELLWEPGCTYNLPELKIVNNGNLALKYKVVVSGVNGNSKLLEAIEFSASKPGMATDAGAEAVPVNLNDFSGVLLPAGKEPITAAEEKVETAPITISGHMKETAGNEYQGESIDGIAITVYATQYTYESDSKDNQYDKDSAYKGSQTITSGTHILDKGGVVLATDTFPVAVFAGNEGTDVTITGGYYDGGSGGDYNVCVWANNGANVTIKGGTFTVGTNSTNDVNSVIYSIGGNITIEGGFFYTQCGPEGYKYILNQNNGNPGTITVKGGTFVNYDPRTGDDNLGGNFVAEGYSVLTQVQPNGDIWYTVVKGTVAGSQDDLNTAIVGKTEATVTLTKSGTYTLPSLEGKTLTIAGTKDTVIDMKGDPNKAASVSFEGVTVKFANANYKGFQHTGKLTYKDCTINGLQFLYADEVEFINCTFDQNNDDSYHIWTYGAKNVTFTGCTFNSTAKSKAVLCYIEGGGQTLTRTFNNCTFTATGTAEKSAIMVNPTANAGAVNTYVVNINNCTATGYAENGIDGQTIVGIKETVKDNITVNIDGTEVYSHTAG